MTEIKITALSERNKNPRRVEVNRDTWEEDGVSHDETRVVMLGPQGKIFGILYVDTADLVAFAEEILREYR